MDTTKMPPYEYEREKGQYSNQYRAYHDPWALYRVYYIEGGKTLKSPGKYLRGAEEYMQARLKEGLCAWIVELPYTDDDIPF